MSAVPAVSLPETCVPAGYCAFIEIAFSIELESVESFDDCADDSRCTDLAPPRQVCGMRADARIPRGEDL